MRKSQFLICALIVTCFAGAATAQFEAEKDEIRAMYETYFKAQNEEDMETSMKYIHPGSRIYKVSKKNLADNFEKYDLKYEYTIEEISMDSAVEADVIIEYRLTRLGGEPHRNQIVRYMADIRKHEGVWRLWAVYLLDREFIK